MPLRPPSVAVLGSVLLAITPIAAVVSGAPLAGIGFAALASVLGGIAFALVLRDAIPGRAYLLEWLRQRPGASRDAGLLRPPGPVGELVQGTAALGHRLDEWVELHRTARHAAEQTERWESEFLATVSHELRTPLNAILGFSQILLDEIDGPLDEGEREDVDTIRQAGQHLQSLVDDVLDLARIESGLFSLDRGPVDAGDVVREAARLLSAQREGRPISIEARIAADAPKVDADPKRLRQVVMNLGTNALKFTDRGSVILVVAAAGDRVRIEVRDTGAGIPQKELDAIFREWEQVEGARAIKGTGLGLAICKRLVDLHGGTIEVESVLGSGSTFTVLLPAWRGA